MAESAVWTAPAFRSRLVLILPFGRFATLAIGWSRALETTHGWRLENQLLEHEPAANMRADANLPNLSSWL
jgi:hypothetical protein